MRLTKMIPGKTILESDPPVILASGLALREGNSKKPIYTIHKWWARRLGSVFRLLLLGATNPARRSAWLKNGAFFEKHDLSDVKVFDPFVGGGTTLVEASKCGASVIGADIDPVATFVTEKELEAISPTKLQTAFESVQASAKDFALNWYRTKLPDGRSGAITYAFWVEEIVSSKTGKVVLGHPHYQLHRNQKKRRQTVFCSNCHAIAEMALRRATFICKECRRKTQIRKGLVANGCVNAPGFKRNQKLIDLYSEANPPRYKLFALQVLIDGTETKVFKRVDNDDLELYRRAEAAWEKIQQTDNVVPSERIPAIHRTDRRPISYGLCKYRDLFNARQLLCLAKIGAAIQAVEDDQCREFLALAFSDCLASNNMLCYYAFDYDKLTPLFGLHAYTKVTRPVENNVWGAEMGRGSFSKCYAKVVRGKTYSTEPYENKYLPDQYHPVRVYTGERIAPKIIRVPTTTKTKGVVSQTALVLNQSSANLATIPSASVHLVLTDPPYFNNLAYSELSDFYHVWLKRLNLKHYNGYTSPHAPMEESLYAGKLSKTPTGNIQAFAEGLGSIFTECRRILVQDGMAVFSYSHNEIPAWVALAFALMRARFRITNVFPVRSEGQSQFHSSEGNLKWDAVFCCRPAAHSKRIQKTPHVPILNNLDWHELKRWQRELREAKLGFSKADSRSLALGLHTKAICNSFQHSPHFGEFGSWQEIVHPSYLIVEEKAEKL